MDSSDRSRASSQESSAMVPKPSVSWPEPRLIASQVRWQPSVPMPHPLELELRFQPAGKLVSGQAGQPRDETVGRQNQESGISHSDQHHHAEVGRVIDAFGLTTLDQQISVSQTGFVAMMTIGDENGPVRHETLHRRVSAGVGHDPEPIDNSEMIGGNQGRAIPQTGLDGPQHLLRDVGIETEDGAQVEARGLVEG